MADPTKLDVGDWLAVVSASILMGLGSAMAWFSKSKDKIYARLDAGEERLNDSELQLERLKICQENLHLRLDDIKEEIQLSAKNGADRVNDKFAQVLDAIKTGRDNPRR